VRLSLALIALALPAVGLAVETSGTPPPPSRTAADIERTIKKAVRAAVVDRNYRRACRFGSERGRRRLLRGYNSSNGDYASCEAVIHHEVEAPDHRFWIARLRDGVVVDVLWVRGRRARTRVADGPAIYPGQGFVLMRRVDGRWRLDNSSLIPYGS
jgi:hypothetical protein